MKETLVNTLRQKDLSLEEFRRVAQRLGWILAAEAGDFLPKRDLTVETPLGPAAGRNLAGDVMLVPVLRAGLALMPAFMDYYPSATVGFVGLKRDEETAVARCYLSNLPPATADTHAFILEPMLATGGSAGKAIQILQDSGIDQSKISVISVVSAPEGLRSLQKTFPAANILVAMQDPELSPRKYIVPGLGDFGDRYFGTPPEV